MSEHDEVHSRNTNTCWLCELSERGTDTEDGVKISDSCLLKAKHKRPAHGICI